VPSSVIGGAMLPHALQFFTMPKERATLDILVVPAQRLGRRDV
jgi:hypothetical protein